MAGNAQKLIQDLSLIWWINLNLVGPDGMTATDWAVYHKNTGMVEYLLEHGGMISKMAAQFQLLCPSLDQQYDPKLTAEFWKNGKAGNVPQMKDMFEKHSQVICINAAYDVPVPMNFSLFLLTNAFLIFLKYWSG